MATLDVHVQVSGWLSMTQMQHIPLFAVEVGEVGEEKGYDYATFLLLVLKENLIEMIV
jgi:hypothetical protein